MTKKTKPAPEPKNLLGQPVCFTCRHWKRLEDVDQMPAEDLLGDCMRFPPVVIGINDEDEVVQGIPITEARHYCGEFGAILQ